MLLNNQWITEEIKEEITKYLEANDNENTTLQNLWDAAKAVLRGKSLAIQAHLRKQEKAQINKLTLHLKQLEREEQTRPKVSRRKEIIKIRAEINEIETKKTIEKINETKRSTKLINPYSFLCFYFTDFCSDLYDFYPSTNFRSCLFFSLELL